MGRPSGTVRGARHVGRTIAGTAVLAVLTAGVWWLWLGSDTTYQPDPVTGASSGPYEAPQIAACVLCLALLCVGGTMLLPPALVAITVTAAFTVTWSIRASAEDSSGLWAVGAALLGFGTAVGTGLAVTATWALRSRLRRRR
ncbi:hypothetical protein CFN78_14845 [Amycolatopsis antarctica]|uniref:Uncharacterized protein n=1 Tax=Amycolatopsis antarctica TaxID=1854586 RepID=A0A263D1G4_9PSEU|nr:hypothetical protein [Amycolatopsis antarctica]OZM72290.1 hypothetical protein CFN78_14845 [Amycolatopsis antarctica]